MVKINYISDLHLEFYGDDVNFEKVMNFDNDAEIICLAGDIGYPEHPNYEKFLSFISGKFKYVFLITGNHEYYHLNNNIDIKTIEKSHLLINKICSNFINVFFLDNRMLFLEEYNLYVIGSTLWSFFDIQKINTKMLKYIYNTNDFKNIFYENNNIIKKFNIDKRNDMFFNSLNFIDESLNFIKNNNNSDNYPKVLVLTHHLPSYKLMELPYRYNINNFIYTTNLDYLFHKYEINAWICGHAHTHYDTIINNCYLGINAYGYPEKNKIAIFNKYFFL